MSLCVPVLTIGIFIFCYSSATYVVHSFLYASLAFFSSRDNDNAIH